jgi:mannose-6-phosphate isomerase-like protein (cupin superfamily)
MADSEVAFAQLDRIGDERFQSLRALLGVRSFGINRIALQPRQRGRIHAHEHQEEVYLVLEGQLTIVIEGVEHVLGPDSVVRVGPAARRQLVNAGPERVVLLALGGSGDHEGRDGRAWASWEDTGPGSSPQDVPAPEDLPIS